MTTVTYNPSDEPPLTSTGCASVNLISNITFNQPTRHWWDWDTGSWMAVFCVATNTATSSTITIEQIPLLTFWGWLPPLRAYLLRIVRPKRNLATS